MSDFHKDESGTVWLNNVPATSVQYPKNMAKRKNETEEEWTRRMTRDCTEAEWESLFL